MEFISPTDDNSSGGAVNRPIRITVRTIGGRHADVERNSFAYHDSISIVNLNRVFRRYGIPLPKSICTHLWMVRDCAGWVGAVFTWFLIIGGELLVMLTLASRQLTFFALLNGILSLSCAVLGIIAHLRSMFTDPVTLLYIYCDEFTQSYFAVIIMENFCTVQCTLVCLRLLTGKGMLILKKIPHAVVSK